MSRLLSGKIILVSLVFMLLGLSILLAEQERIKTENKKTDDKTSLEWPYQSFSQKVTIKPSFFKQEKLEVILDELFKDTKKNYILRDPVDVIIKFKMENPASLEELLDKLLLPLDYVWEYREQDNMILIRKKSTDNMESKVYYTDPVLKAKLVRNIKPLLTSKGEIKVLLEDSGIYVRDITSNIKAIDMVVEKMEKKGK